MTLHSCLFACIIIYCSKVYIEYVFLNAFEISLMITMAEFI